MMKRKLTLLLAALVVFSMVCFHAFPTAQAAEASGTFGTLKWAVSGTTLTITGSGTITGNAFTSYPWDAYRSQITKLVVGDYVTGINGTAFQDMTMLNEVKLGIRLEQIGESAFSRCSSLMEISIPVSVTAIGKAAFYKCTNLLEVVIPTLSRLESIGGSAFSGCTSLLSLTLPNSLKTLGNYAFEDCINLVDVKLGSKLESIGVSAFENCTSLVSINLPASLRTIGSGAFKDCAALPSITLNSGLQTIGREAFSGCISLANALKIPSSVTTWDEESFYGCTKLPSVVITSACSIPQSAFSHCNSLKTVTINGKATAISSYAFRQCSGLETLTMNDNITSFGYAAFQGCNALKDFRWPVNLATIGNNAFENCTSLTKIQLPALVNKIGEQAFRGCTALQEITLERSVADLGGNAFWGCTALQSFTNYSANTKMENNFFGGIFREANDQVVLYGFPNSTTNTYATENELNFVPITALETPATNKIVNTVSGVHVYWKAVPGAAYYTVYRATNPNGPFTVLKAACAPVHYTDTAVTSGGTYYYKVMAKNSSVSSELSAVQKLTYVATPDITSRFNKAAGITLGWNKIEGATGYAIYRKSFDGSDAWVRVATIEGNSTFTWNDASVKNKNGEIYRYTIRALTGKTLSGCRNTGRTMVRLTSMTLTGATAGKNSIKATWSTTSKATGYEVRFMVGSTVYKTVTIGNYKTGTKTFPELPAGTYKVQVRTYKRVAEVGSFYSAWSVAKTVTVK